MTEERGGVAAWGAFAACSGIWGSTFLFISLGSETLPPVWSAVLRLAAAAVILTVLALVTQGLPRGDALRAAALYGVFGFGFNFPLLYWAEQVVPSGLAAVLYSTIPLSTALLARAVGLERLTRAKVVGALLGLVGVAVIFWSRIGADVSLLPLLALLAGATLASFGGVMLKRGPRQPAIGANAVGSAVGLPFALVGTFIAGERPQLPEGAGELIPLAYLTLAGSVGAYVLMAWLINRWSATRVSFITLVIPVVAVFLGATVRDEPVTPAILLGSVIVAAGVALGLQGDRLLRRPAEATAR